MNPLTKALVAVVRGYQKWISPAFAPTCRYYPTCSHYAVAALTTHGVAKGTVLAGWRVLRCNPWSLGGVDHVPAQGRWKAPEWIPPDDWVGHDIPDRSQKRFPWSKTAERTDGGWGKDGHKSAE